VIIEPSYGALEARNFTLRKLAAATEVCGKRRNAPREQAVQQALTCRQQPISATYYRRAEKAAAVLLSADGLFQ
jgi:hypothetical protein